MRIETPPRTWGRQYPEIWDAGTIRNTPTDVGKTAGTNGIWIDDEKHPHGRGEDDTLAEQTQVDQETPPRTWGRRHLSNRFKGCDGNTPTDVGKTLYR